MPTSENSVPRRKPRATTARSADAEATVAAAKPKAAKRPAATAAAPKAARRAAPKAPAPEAAAPVEAAAETVKPVAVVVPLPVATATQVPVPETVVPTVPQPAAAPASSGVLAVLAQLKPFGVSPQIPQESTQMLFKNYDDYVAFASANADAMTTAYTIACKGVDAYSKALFAFQKLVYEMTMATTREVMQAKSLNEVVDLQTNYASKLADNFMVETNKLSEFSMKVANEAMEPLNKRLTATVDQVNKSVEAMTVAA